MAQPIKRDLRAYMREDAKKEEVVTVPGPILDKDGNPDMLEIKVLSNATIQEINDAYKEKVIATDGKGNPYIANGEVALRVERNNRKASQHIIAEALVHPNLKDPELMKFFECNDITEMPMKVFPKSDEYTCVSRAVMAALGLIDEPTKEETNKTIDEVKN